ncbi:MAG: phosphate ABC transporter substrate-binding protein PstS [Chloroflexota bacterium]
MATTAATATASSALTSSAATTSSAVTSSGTGASTAATGTAAYGSFGPPVVDKSLSGALTGAGSTFDFPLFSAMFAEYHKLVAGVTVNYQSIGSGGGIQQFTQRTVDFGASDAPLNDSQEKALPSPGLHVPVTIGAVSVGYNLPGVQSGLKLSGDVLAGIYLEEITTWNDAKITALNPDLKLPATPIAVVHRSDGSGTSFIFTNYLSAVSATWKSKVGTSTSVNWPVGIGGKGSEGVAGQVKHVPGSIGYFELAYSKENNISYVTMQNKDGKYVEPSSAGASAAAAGAANNMPADLKATFPNPAGPDVYPIAGFSWVLFYEQQTDQAKATVLAHLLDWVVTDGQQLGEKLYYAPLPPPVVQLCRAQLRKMTVNGKPVLA